MAIASLSDIDSNETSTKSLQIREAKSFSWLFTWIGVISKPCSLINPYMIVESKPPLSRIEASLNPPNLLITAVVKSSLRLVRGTFSQSQYLTSCPS